MATPERPINVVLGVLSVFLGHVLACLLMFLVTWIASFVGPMPNELGIVLLYAFFFIGITQLLYVIPLGLWLRHIGRFDTMKGVVIGTVITMLLNGACFLSLAGSFGL